MAYPPCIQAGYTVREAFIIRASFDGAAYVNISWSALDHYDTIYALLAAIKSKVDTACGSNLTVMIDWTTDVGKVYINARIGHTIAINWGTSTEGVRLRNFLGWAAHLAPGAQIWTAPSIHLGGWYPSDLWAIQGIDEANQGYEGVGRADAWVDVLSHRNPIKTATVTLNTKCLNAGTGDLREVYALFTVLEYLLDGETWGLVPDSSDQATYYCYRLMPTNELSSSPRYWPDATDWPVTIQCLEVS